jgi:hypothetical protein
MDNCPICSGEMVYIGTLGRRDNFRCRHCGLDHSIKIHKIRRFR